MLARETKGEENREIERLKTQLKRLSVVIYNRYCRMVN